MDNNIIYSWSFSNDKQRWALWYTIALSVVFWIVIWWFLSSQYPMSFLTILIAWVYFFIENNSEEFTQVYINQLWIWIANNFYEFSKILSYRIIYTNWQANTLRLALNRENIWVKFIDLDINNDIAINLNQLLVNVIKQDPESEISLTDKIIKILKL